jgi:hypothetical protein
LLLRIAAEIIILGLIFFHLNCQFIARLRNYLIGGIELSPSVANTFVGAVKSLNISILLILEEALLNPRT